MLEPRLGHWTVAGLTALALHAGLMLFFLAPSTDGAKAPGIGGISIGMTLVAARQGAEADAREQAAQSPVEPAPPPATAAEAPPPDAAEPPPQTATDTVQALEPLPPVAPEVVTATAVEPQPVKPEATKTETVRPARPLPLPERRPQPPKPTAEPAKKSAPEQPTDETEPAAPADRRQQASQAASASQGRLSQGRKGASADSHDALGGGPVGTPAPNYVNVLRYWLERHKTYPKDARRQRMQGIVHLYFRVTRDGRVLRHEIRKTSGHALLDGEAEAMLARAQPLPEFTPGMKGGYLDVVVPVLFSLRGNR